MTTRNKVQQRAETAQEERPSPKTVEAMQYYKNQLAELSRRKAIIVEEGEQRKSDDEIEMNLIAFGNLRDNITAELKSETRLSKKGKQHFQSKLDDIVVDRN